MDVLKQADLKRLIEISKEWCVSFYMPTHPKGRETQQDLVRFRNLIVQTQKQLLECGVRRSQVEEIMRPAEDLSITGDFWKYQSHGLALFLAPGFIQTYRLPFRFDETLVIATKFHITPLLPLLSENDKFYILTISMNRIRLYLGDRNDIEEIGLKNIPTNIEEALRLDEPERYLGFHTGASSPGRGTMRRAVFHGRGGKTNFQKSNLLRYFQIVDRGLNALLVDKYLPMVLVGLGYLLPIYRHANTYSRLMDEGLEGNPEELDVNSLRKLAWELVEPVFTQDQKAAAQRLQQLVGQKSELVITDLPTIVKASYKGMVESLYLPMGMRQPETREIKQRQRIHEEESNPENEEMLDLAVIYTLTHSGKIYTIREPEELPGSALAAVLRFATWEE